MTYLISMFDCILSSNDYFTIQAGVKYKIEKPNKCMVFPINMNIPFLLDFDNLNETVLKVKCGFDTYYFLTPKNINDFFTTTIKFNNKILNISLSNKLLVAIDGMLICEKNVENLNYSHFEIEKDLCFVYFVGKRNFVLILKKGEVEFASFYDECNVKDNEKYFMCRLCDSLNHGSVCHIKDNEISKYLVYLDNEDLNLKSIFVPHVFLDCLKVGNYNYCNQLLSDNLKMKNAKDIKSFFEEFDYLYPIDDRKFILINKNTLAGIYEFEVENDLITNIIRC